jgi:hypothetical protein
MKTNLLTTAVLFFLGFATHAQVTTSNIRGTVTDGQSITLLGANVVAIHSPTGTKYGAITNEDGRFNLLNLRVGGPYEVTVSYVGYSTHISDDIYLALGTTYNLDVELAAQSEELEEVVVVSDRSGTFGCDRTCAESSV